jgi:pSer/pThr/pTyr-binding forkhead associated (FHA) protein
MKSYHGTFVNDERLSAEAQESDPRELHTGDIIVSAMLFQSFNLDVSNAIAGVGHRHRRRG